MEKKEKNKKIKKENFKMFLNSSFKKYKYNIIFSKYLLIASFFLGNKIYVYNGLTFRKIFIFVFLICLRFGIFVHTKKPFKYLLKKKKR